MDAIHPLIVSIAVPRPIDSFFTYLAPLEWKDRITPGAWVRVPFGRSEVIGFVVAPPEELSKLPPHIEVGKLKSILEVGDPELRMPDEVFDLCKWTSKFYSQALGEVLQAAYPASAMGLKSAKKESKELKEVVLSAPKKPSLTALQSQALDQIESLRKSGSASKVLLLHGVTGSGKTEVYISAAQKVLDEGKSVLLLLPEIALTSHLKTRFEEGLGVRVALWHSAMPDARRRDETAALLKGQIRVVVGARSAVFAPLKNIGLIIVDEEHDPTFKQEERVRYHARDVAIVRGKELDATVILGSATPSIESQERVREGKFQIAKLPERFSSGGMPEIRLVDLKSENVISGIQAQITESVFNELRDTIERGEQAMIFLNRRGFAAFLLCEDCGEVSNCPNCSISLTVHKRTRKLRCHLCDHLEMIPDVCEKCGSEKLTPMGAGTESVEDELPKLFPGIRVLRLDRDTVTSASRLDRTLDAFRNKEADVLLGTQMLVKGHDFPNVTLVIVLLADSLFRYPDFRAPERAYQILTQVAGRSGRGDRPGKTMIQTYQPEHLIFEAIQNETVKDQFYTAERELRQALSYPPFGRIARIRIEDSDEGSAKKNAKTLADAILEWSETKKKENAALHFDVLGPSEAFLEKVKGIYRYDSLLKTNQISALHECIASAKIFASQRKWSVLVDIDPYGLG